MQGYGDAVERHLFAIGYRLQPDIFAQAQPQKALAVCSGQIAPAVRPGMIGMRMGDDRTIDRPPGINVKFAGWAINAGRVRFEKSFV